MLCENIEHNISWRVIGKVTPCNYLTNFPLSNTVAEMKNLPEYQQLVIDNANDQKSPFCQKCWDKEKFGHESKRITDNRVGKVYSKINPNYIKIDAAIGDKCNAACVICGPSSSTGWQKQLYGKVINLKTTNPCWDDVEANYDNIIQLDFGGGEPWLNNVSKQCELFERLIRDNRASDIKLRYNTNGSLYPKQLIDYFKHFRSVEITLSIDDHGRRFEYNRWPLQWQDVYENVQNLVEVEKNHANIRLTINYTVSVLTFLYVDEFVEFSKKLGVPKVSWSVLHLPKVYNIKSIDDETKERIPKTNLFYDLISTQPYPTWHSEFLSTVDNLDTKRDLSFENTFPELYKILTQRK